MRVQFCNVRVAGGSSGDTCTRKAVYYVPALRYCNGYVCGQHCPKYLRTKENHIAAGPAQAEKGSGKP